MKFKGKIAITKAAQAALVFSILLHPGCKSSIQKKELEHIKIMVNYPLVMPQDGKVNNLRDTVPVYYYKDMVLYFTPYRRTIETPDKLLSEEIRYSLFLYKNDSPSGYFFATEADSTRPQKLPVDSFLLKRAFAAKFDTTNKKLVSTDAGKKGELTEKYIPNYTHDETFFDTAIFQYDEKLNHIPFSFSNNLDRLRNKKLYRVRLIYDEKYSQTYKILVPGRELSYEIQQYPVSDEQKIITLFENLEKKVSAEYPQALTAN